MVYYTRLYCTYIYIRVNKQSTRRTTVLVVPSNLKVGTSTRSWRKPLFDCRVQLTVRVLVRVLLLEKALTDLYTIGFLTELCFLQLQLYRYMGYRTVTLFFWRKFVCIVRLSGHCHPFKLRLPSRPESESPMSLRYKYDSSRGVQIARALCSSLPCSSTVKLLVLPSCVMLKIKFSLIIFCPPILSMAMI